jgi:hypothetical protein
MGKYPEKWGAAPRSMRRAKDAWYSIADRGAGRSGTCRERLTGQQMGLQNGVASHCCNPVAAARGVAR